MKHKIFEIVDDGKNSTQENKSFHQRIQYWFKNYWYYYKFHTFAAIFIILISIFAIHNCVTAVDVDLCIYYVSKSPIVYNEDIINLKNRFSQYTEDFNGDGIVRVEIVNYYIGDDYDQEKVKENKDNFAKQYQAGGVKIILADNDGLKFLEEGNYLCNMNEFLNDNTDSDSWKVNGSSFADCKEIKTFENTDLYLGFRVFNEKSIIRIIPGTVKEVEFAKATINRIIHDNKVN